MIGFLLQLYFENMIALLCLKLSYFNLSNLFIEILKLIALKTRQTILTNIVMVKSDLNTTKLLWS